MNNLPQHLYHISIYEPYNITWVLTSFLWHCYRLSFTTSSGYWSWYKLNLWRDLHPQACHWLRRPLIRYFTGFGEHLWKSTYVDWWYNTYCRSEVTKNDEIVFTLLARVKNRYLAPKCQSSNSLAETKNFQNRSDGQLTANVDWKVQHKTVWRAVFG